MSSISNQTREWFLDEDHLTDGASIGGFDTIQVANIHSSKFAVKVYFDGNFQFGVNQGESKSKDIKGKTILVTVKPAIDPAKDDFAQGDFILSAKRTDRSRCS